MHADLEKLVEAGKLKPAVAGRLDQLSPGKFLLHNSWGAGKVVEWDLPNRKLVIDFEKQRRKEMDLQFAISKTTPLEPDDFRAQKVAQMEYLQELAEKDPAALVIHLLESHDGSLPITLLEDELKCGVIPEGKFKKWWEGAKRELRHNKRVHVPSRRNEPLILRNTDLSHKDLLLSDFQEARDLKSMVAAAESILAELAVFEDQVEPLREVLDALDESARKGSKLHLSAALELLSLRDQLVDQIEEFQITENSSSLAEILRAGEDQLGEELRALSAAHQRVIYRSFPEAFEMRWIEVIMNVFDQANTRGAAEIFKLLEEKDSIDEFETHIRQALQRRALGPDALIWIVRERERAAVSIFTPEVGSAILNLLEIDQISDGPRKAARLQSIVSEDKTLLKDLVDRMSITEARNFARRLLECPVFSELDKKSLMARVIKAKPETGSLVSDQETSAQDEQLVVSWESLERRQAELEDIIRNRIPQNTKDIAIARSYGDMRENFEFKSAKEQQAMLLARKAELQGALARARGSDFKGADTSMANIGTVVNLVNAAGDTTRYTLLGAWDSDVEKHIVSYLSVVGAALLHKKPGETVEIRDPQTEVMTSWTIQSIEPYLS